MSRKTFNKMRSLAGRKRDQAIQRAHDEYDQAIVEIDALQAKLAPVRRGGQQPDTEPITSIIIRVMPDGKSFTITECLATVRAAVPDRQFTRAGIRKSLYRLATRGAIIQIDVRSYSLLETTFGGKKLAVWIDNVVENANRSLSPLEVLVELRELGVQIVCNAGDAINYVSREYRNPH